MSWQETRVPFGERIALSEVDPDDTGPFAQDEEYINTFEIRR